MATKKWSNSWHRSPQAGHDLAKNPVSLVNPDPGLTSAQPDGSDRQLTAVRLTLRDQLAPGPIRPGRVSECPVGSLTHDYCHT